MLNTTDLFLFLWQECVPDDFEPAEPRMYKVGLGMGYLELPQGRHHISGVQCLNFICICSKIQIREWYRIYIRQQIHVYFYWDKNYILTFASHCFSWDSTQCFNTEVIGLQKCVYTGLQVRSVCLVRQDLPHIPGRKNYF